MSGPGFSKAMRQRPPAATGAISAHVHARRVPTPIFRYVNACGGGVEEEEEEEVDARETRLFFVCFVDGTV